MKFNKILTIMLSFILVIIISATAVTAQSAAYYPKDVAPGHWAYKSICNVGKSGLMIGRGTPNGVVFDPNGTITGAEMFMTMYRLAGMPTEIPNLDFEITSLDALAINSMSHGKKVSVTISE